MEEKIREIENLIKIIRRLIGPGGCPWDRQQTVESVSRYLVEEAWEFFDAQERKDNGAMEEELGDVLMIAFLIGEIAAKEGRFTLESACRVIAEKLIRRHPHVFGNERVASAAQVKAKWEEIKREEGKGEGEDGLPQLPASLPALTQAVKIGKAAAEYGFDWPDRAGPLSKVSEEWEELKQAVARDDPEFVYREMGDLLFALTSLCRKMGVDPEAALRAALARFRKRFAKVYEGIATGELKDLASMEKRWQETKKKEDP